MAQPQARCSSGISGRRAAYTLLVGMGSSKNGYARSWSQVEDPCALCDLTRMVQGKSRATAPDGRCSRQRTGNADRTHRNSLLCRSARTCDSDHHRYAVSRSGVDCRDLVPGTFGQQDTGERVAKPVLPRITSSINHPAPSNLTRHHLSGHFSAQTVFRSFWNWGTYQGYPSTEHRNIRCEICLSGS